MSGTPRNDWRQNCEILDCNAVVGPTTSISVDQNVTFEEARAVSWFRSWINRKSPTEVDAATAGGLPLYLFFEKKDPFVYVFNEEIFAAWTGERTLPDDSKPILRAVAVSF